MPKNWKTTTLGILAITGVVVHVATKVLTGDTFDMKEISADWTALVAGWGLIHAADAKPTTPAK